MPLGGRMTLKNVTLDDKYDLTQSRVFVTGYQALIRATLMQQERDRLAGLSTAGYVSGYRGSPLGGLDQQFMRAKPHLDKHNVPFQTGLNEDPAPTAVWGTQQAEWDTSDNNRRAKYYELTAKGRKRLREETDWWNRLAAAVATVLAAEPGRA